MTDLNKNFLTLSSKATLSGRDEINERIDNLIMSVKGTHLFNRGFGFINRVLFRDLTETSANSLINSIFSLLSDNVPEIAVDESRSQAIPVPEDGCYIIQLYYSVISTGESGTYQNSLEVTNG